LSKSQGNPFFSEEIAYALRDTGLIEIVDGVCRITQSEGDLKDIAFPETIEGVVTSRIDQLKAKEQLTLKVASVIGRIFEYRALRDIYPVSTERSFLGENLSRLQTVDITQLNTPEPDLTYLFNHIITREVAYNLLLFQQRKDLHRLIAAWYEESYANALSPHYSLLAYHWQTGDEPQKAFEYLELAGEQAIDNGAYRDAITFFKQVIEINEKYQLVQDQVRAASWERSLGESYFSIGDLKMSKHHHLAAVNLLQRPFYPEGGRLILHLFGEVFRQMAHRFWNDRYLGAATGETQHECSLEGARAYERLSHIMYFENNTFATLSAGLASLNLSEQVGTSMELVRAYGTTSVTAGLVGLHKLAGQYETLAKDVSIEVSGQPGFLAAEGWRLMMEGTYHAGADSLKQAAAAMQSAIDIWEQLGEKQRWKEALSLLTTIQFFLGDYDAGLQSFEKFYIPALNEENEQFQFWALMSKAMIKQEQGKIVQSLEILKDILPESGLDLGMADKIWLEGINARVHLRLGNVKEAHAGAVKTLGFIRKSQPTAYYLLESYSAVVEIFLAGVARGKSSTDKRRLRQAMKALDAFARSFPFARPRADLWQGKYQLLKRNPQKAREYTERSLHLAQVLEMPYEQGLAHLQLSKLSALAVNGTDHLKQAAVLFTELGAAFELEIVDKE
jgi:tetratricopeptide (TPR) repeat protein